MAAAIRQRKTSLGGEKQDENKIARVSKGGNKLRIAVNSRDFAASCLGSSFWVQGEQPNLPGSQCPHRYFNHGERDTKRRKRDAGELLPFERGQRERKLDRLLSLADGAPGLPMHTGVCTNLPHFGTVREVTQMLPSSTCPLQGLSVFFCSLLGPQLQSWFTWPLGTSSSMRCVGMLELAAHTLRSSPPGNEDGTPQPPLLGKRVGQRWENGQEHSRQKKCYVQTP